MAEPGLSPPRTGDDQPQQHDAKALIGTETPNWRESKIIDTSTAPSVLSATEGEFSADEKPPVTPPPVAEEAQQQNEKSEKDLKAGDEEEEEFPPTGGLKEGDEAKDYVTGFKLWSVLVSTAVLFFLVLLDNSILSTAIPRITTQFHSLPDQGWYVGAYQLTSSVLQPLTGKIYTYFNTKWTFLFFFTIFEIGSLLCGVATSSNFFIAGRAVAGVGVSGLQNGALSVIAGSVPLEKRALYLGILIGIGQIGVILGPVIGGLLTQYVTWRWCFYINLPIGGVAGFIMTFIHVPEQIVKAPFSWDLVRRTIPKFDIIGFVIFAPAATFLLLALQLGAGGTYTFQSTIVIVFFVLFAVFAIAFVLWEWKAGEVAIIPFSMITKRVVWASTLQYTTLIGSVFVAVTYLPIYFQSVKGAPPVLSGVYLLPSIISQLLFGLISGALIPRVGYYVPFAILAGAGATVAGGLLTTLQENTPTADWIGYQIIFGLRGCGIQIAIVAIQNALPARQSQLGTAFLVFTQNFTSAVFVVIGNTIYQQALKTNVHRLVPSITPAQVIAAGSSAEGVRSLVPEGGEKLHLLIKAYANAYDMVSYLMLALATVSFLAAFGTGWVNIKKKKAEAGAAAAAPAIVEA
ncbi:major facilitator superfamily domain-containing protein [Xylariaceae sp. FL0255]|nr:major facilitator superfamily domain-containing protein [Xylariaceae sp. FL0255]